MEVKAGMDTDGFDERTAAAVIVALKQCPAAGDASIVELARKLYASDDAVIQHDVSCVSLMRSLCGTVALLLEACRRQNRQLLDAISSIAAGRCERLIREVAGSLKD
jgi:predicted exporter